MYCNNLLDLDVTVNGQLLDSKYIVNVYQSALNRKPYVVMFEDDNGQIKEQDGIPVRYEIEGDITVTGNITTCGCWTKRRVKRWWDKVNAGRAGW